MFTKVLVPLDQSSLAEQALGRAAAIARASHAEIELVMVHEPFQFGGFDDAPWGGAEGDAKYLQATARELATGATVPIGNAVVRGGPAEGIAARARNVGADLIVMTSHGRTGLSRAWIGSVADAVVRNSGVPVLMLRPIEGKTARTAMHNPFKQVLVPLDGSASGLEILAPAAALARCTGARILLVRVVQPVPLVAVDADMSVAYTSYTIDDAATQALVSDAKQRLDGVARSLIEQEKVEVEVEAHVVVASGVARALLDFAHGHAADVIAMTTHGRGGSRLLIGSIADKILRASDLPVMLLRPTRVRDTVAPVASSSGTRSEPAERVSIEAKPGTI